jgi:hypothetical protein
VATSRGIQDACAREDAPRGMTGGNALALGVCWPREQCGRGPNAAYGRAAAEQRGERKQGQFSDFQKFRDLSII